MGTAANGAVTEDYLYYPWGQEWTVAGTATEYHFAGFAWHDDTSADLEPALFRNYASTEGHWLSPDPLGGDPNPPLWQALYRRYSSYKGRWLSPDPLGGDVTNPQSLNRYAYALNNPATFVDPLGLYQNCPNGVVFNNQCYETASPGLSTLGYDFICMMSISSCPYYNGQGQSMGGGGGSGGGGTPTPGPNSPLKPANNGKPQSLVPANPCQYAGGALGPSAYASQGKVDNGHPFTIFLNSVTGFPRGHFFDPQPFASGTPLQKASYGNYTFGVYMSAAGVSLSTALFGANAYAFFSDAHYGPSNGPMDSNYGSLPAANVVNITNGFNAEKNGAVCSAQSPLSAPPPPPF